MKTTNAGSGAVHIIRHGRNEAEVHIPFEAKDLLKEVLPRAWRRWDADAKLWFCIADAVDELAAELRAAGYHVVVRDAPGTGHRSQQSNTSTWADSMYAALGQPLGDRAHRALSRVLHPDAGGDLEAMKALNAARDRAHQTARAA